MNLLLLKSWINKNSKALSKTFIKHTKLNPYYLLLFHNTENWPSNVSKIPQTVFQHRIVKMVCQCPYDHILWPGSVISQTCNMADTCGIRSKTYPYQNVPMQIWSKCTQPLVKMNPCSSQNVPIGKKRGQKGEKKENEKKFSLIMPHQSHVRSGILNSKGNSLWIRIETFMEEFFLRQENIFPILILFNLCISFIKF